MKLGITKTEVKTEGKMQVLWQITVVPATMEAEAAVFLEPAIQN